MRLTIPCFSLKYIFVVAIFECPRIILILSSVIWSFLRRWDASVCLGVCPVIFGKFNISLILIKELLCFDLVLFNLVSSRRLKYCINWETKNDESTFKFFNLS